MLGHAFRPKDCAVCGKSFIPFKSMQKVCGIPCAKKVAKAVRAQGKRELRARKEAIKTIPELLKEAQGIFNKFIRTRDAEKPCISCGVGLSEGVGVRSHGTDAGHFRSVGSASHLRFHEDNVHAQCVRCNRWGSGRAIDYRIGLANRIGLARLEALEADNTPHKWTREELIEIRAKYKAKLKELEKERA